MPDLACDSDKPRAVGLLKGWLLNLAVVSSFLFGLYSLVLASQTSGSAKPLSESGLVRTATGKDTDRIALALGPTVESGLAFVVVEDPAGQRDLTLEQSARHAAKRLIDSGLVASARRLQPADPDYVTIIEQNTIAQFPAVLVVKKNAGIVLVTGDLGTENLLHAYDAVWGKKSDCGAAKTAVY